MPVFAAGAPKLPAGFDSVDPYAYPFIAPCAHLIGDVTVTENASVWYGAVIRGDHQINKSQDLLMDNTFVRRDDRRGDERPGQLRDRVGRGDGGRGAS